MRQLTIVISLMILGVAWGEGAEACTTDAECGPCQECVGGVCAPQAPGSDVKGDCTASACQSGDCDGAGSCESRPFGTDCGTCAVCDGTGSCSVYDGTQDADCDALDLPAVATCAFTPDGDPDTWDAHAAVNSECVGLGSCSNQSGYADFTHTCNDIDLADSVADGLCSASCDEDTDCDDGDPQTVEFCDLETCSCAQEAPPVPGLSEHGVIFSIVAMIGIGVGAIVLAGRRAARLTIKD